MRWPRADLLSLGILIATIASVVAIVEAGGGGSGSKGGGSGTKSTTTVEQDASQTGGGSRTVVKHGHWAGTVGPLTLTVTEVEREGTTVRLAMSAAGESKVTIPFFDNLQATDAAGHLYKAQDEQEVLNVVPQVTSKATVTLEGVTEAPLFLTLAFATLYPADPTFNEVFANGIRVEGIAVPG